MPRLIRASGKAELQAGEMKLVEEGDERILLVNIDDNFYAVSEVCTHSDAPLSEGFLEGEEIECPWHVSRFSLKTGEASEPPAIEPLKVYTVKVEGEDIFIEVP